MTLANFFHSARAPSNSKLPPNLYLAGYFALGTLVLSAAILGVSVFLTRKQSKLISKFARQSTPKLETLSDYELSQLDVYLLRSLRYTRKEKELARATGVDPQVITHKLNLLYTLGYVTKNTELTEKGYDVINRPDSGSRQPGAPVASAEQPTQPTVGLTRQRQDHATSNKTSKYVKWVLVVIALLIIFLLAPIVPYSTSSGIALGASVELTAQTSMSYAIFQCELVSNPHVSGSYLGSSISYVPFTGTRWVCGNSVSG